VSFLICIFYILLHFQFFFPRLDPEDRNRIARAMETLMYSVGTPAPTAESSTWRLYNCIFFRPRTPNDKTFVTIEYGTGCWANVSKTIRRLCNINFNQLLTRLDRLLPKLPIESLFEEK
jgi:hypothetical protein